MKTWTEILTENQEGIRAALRDAYRSAAQGTRGSGFQECVEITRDGAVSTYTISRGSTSMDVYKGTAMEIHRFNWFDPLDGVEGSDALDFLRGENLLEPWIEWLQKEEHVTGDITGNELVYLVWTIAEWDRDAWSRYEAEVRVWIEGEFDPDPYLDEALYRASEYDLCIPGD